MTMIETKDLTFAYPAEEGKRSEPALRGVSLGIEKGSFVVVLGHNGSGKSTLAKHMNAVLLPSGGAVYVEGMDTRDQTVLLEIRRRVGMVFQNPDNQIVANVVEEDVAFAPENLGVPPQEIRRRVDDALEAVGMSDFARHAPHLLSGGQKQRVAIAGVIAMEPECIVLDEATAMLDPHGRREVLDTIHRLNRERGMTVVLITHHMAEAEEADRVIVMNDGEAAMDGTPREIFAQVERLHELGLAAPDTVELMQRLNRQGEHLPLTAITVEQLTHTYSAGTPFQRSAVAGVELDIMPGEFLGVIGHTGSGKSTLIQHLNGLLKPTQGHIYLNGKDIWADPKQIRQVRFQVGLVFQYPEYQLFEETVYKDIAFGPGNMGLDKEEIDRRVRESARMVGLAEELLEKSPFDLSGGQKRRVAIAGVMAMEPKVLILDEPTAGLDPRGRDEILAQIRAYHETKRATVILVSHSMEEIARNVGRIVVMRDAHVYMDGTPRRVFARAEELEQAGLDVPQVTKIAMALRRRGMDIDPAVYTIEELEQALLARRGGGEKC